MAGFAEYKERRLERLRLGQAAAEIVPLLSDPETRIALVPLTEGEYSTTIEWADAILAGDNPAGLAARDEAQKRGVIYFAARETRDFTAKFFDTYEDVSEIEAHDLNYLYDVYLEMVALNSPSMMGMSEDDFLALRDALPKIQWSELSGTQWYAAQRFLNSIRDHLLTARSSGSPAIVKSTPTSDELDSVESATGKNSTTIV